MKPNIEEIRKMLAAATPGPWSYNYEFDEIGPVHDTHGDFAICKKVQWYDNAQLIAKAPETIAALCDEVERQERLIHAQQTNLYTLSKLGEERLREVERQSKEIDELGNENIEYTKALEFIIATYEEDGTDIQVARKMVKLAREALRRDTPQ